MYVLLQKTAKTGYEYYCVYGYIHNNYYACIATCSYMQITLLQIDSYSYIKLYSDWYDKLSVYYLMLLAISHSYITTLR